MIQSRGEKVFSIFNYSILALIALISLYPLWDVIRISLSTPFEASKMGLTLWPQNPTLMSYHHVLGNNYIWMGYKNTFFRVVLGMSIQMTLMVLTGYCLSKKYFPNRSFWTMFIVFTMFFSGGLIPRYLLFNNTLNLGNTIWALVLPRAIDTFALIILRNYMMSLPEELEESAKIDGASQITILVRIILPLCKPILMTVALWGIVWHWNSWFDCLIYIRDPGKYVLQAVLRKIVIDASPQFDEMMTGMDTVDVNAEVVKAATIIVSTIPIMMVYPFVQKYFIKGMIVGSLKG